MNGVFKQYKIELYDYSQKLIQSYETEDGKLDITGLESETQYLVKIYYVNHVGFNPTVSLQHKFTTKPDTLVRELTAYKTTATMIGLRWKMDVSTIIDIDIELRTETGNKTIYPTGSIQCKPWPGLLCYEVNGLLENTIYTITVNTLSKDLPEGRESKPIVVVTKETAPSAVSEITLKHSSDTNMTLSWRIPFTLNGTLRSFDIQLEQLSSFDDKICCQINKTTYPVSEEQEIYSLILQDIKPASSYQINIRPLARRLGPEAKEIIETPPPRVPFQHVPLVRIDGKKIKFPIQNNSVDASDNVYKTLATEILIIKQIIEGKTNETSETTDSIRADMSQILGNNNWFLIQVCKVADVNCTVDVKPDYPDIIIFKILLVQVNQYLSAKSYTILESYLYP
uniref:Fibronectin type-III domain-containing protein n=1 Tax=Cacopsylla melanoneura TaxID=428564 RepID=A0A8D8QAU2_9HEMI